MTQSNSFLTPDSFGSNGAGSSGGHTPGYTGRFLVTFEPGASEQAASVLRNQAGIEAVSSREVGVKATSENTVFEEIGVAVVSALPDEHGALLAAASDANVPVRHVERERIVWASMFENPQQAATNGTSRGLAKPQAFAQPSAPTASSGPAPALAVPASANLNTEFLRGYFAAIQGLLAGAFPALADSGTRVEVEAATAAATYGLNITGVVNSTRSGQGIRVAVLDTGFDLNHPDFAGRTVVTQSFVTGEAVQDGHGHGTHCIGTSCGPRSVPGNPRYGIAFNAAIYAGKVLSNAGSGGDGGILAGINWAVQNQCQVISMSLGSPVSVGEPFSQAYQNAAAAAEKKGTLIVCAGGNDSHRPGQIAPVGHPANCPTILAVAAIDSTLAVASFSDGSVNPNGGEVNVAGPGVNVFSSWPMPLRYRTISGTSMATPHVAGIAALFAEATGLRGLALANEMLRHARRLFPVSDFGWGLVQAPV
ncbi:MAG: S8 family serine peptidase [Polyangiaceae bacterium]